MSYEEREAMRSELTEKIREIVRRQICLILEDIVASSNIEALDALKFRLADVYDEFVSSSLPNSRKLTRQPLPEEAYDKYNTFSEFFENALRFRGEIATTFYSKCEISQATVYRLLKKTSLSRTQPKIVKKICDELGANYERVMKR